LNNQFYFKKKGKKNIKGKRQGFGPRGLTGFKLGGNWR